MAPNSMARPKKKKKGMSVSTVLSIVIIILLALGIGLWLLKENAPTPVTTGANQVAVKPVPNTTLPSRPEEVYSYIRDLETREVITDPSKGQPKSAQLSKEQLKQLEEKRKQEEASRLALEQPTTPAVETQTTQANETATTATEQPAALSETDLAAQKAQEQKVLEEKRKQADLKKQQELAKKEAEKAKAEKAKAEQAKTEQAKTPAKAEEKTAAQPKAGSFGLQCGAFKNKAQAENMQARLAMAGFNARIVSGADWNRVFVGPVGNRAAASTAQSNARSVAECVIVAM